MEKTMSIINATEAKQNSENHQPKKTLETLRNEIAAQIKASSDLGYFSAGYTIPSNVSAEDQEAILAELNQKKYSLDTTPNDNGLDLFIKWFKPAP